MKENMIRIDRLQDIHSDLLKQAFEVRRTVFVEEQRVDERDEFDEHEVHAIHFVASIDNNVVGTSRCRKAGNGVKLERFAVLPAYRKSGVGRELLKHTLEEALQLGNSIYLHAQLSAVRFYEKGGFEKTGPEFEECNIKHYKMIYTGNQHQSYHLTVQKAIGHVRDFHDAFGIGNESVPVGRIEEKDFLLRYRLMKEENEEYLEAAKSGDLVEIADALGDMFYILCGTILKHGLQDRFAVIFEEIQRSNMSKLDRDGNPIYRDDGKVMKSDLYFKPDLAALLKDYL